jgi:hypothetical protein
MHSANYDFKALNNKVNSFFLLMSSVFRLANDSFSFNWPFVLLS